MKETVPSGGGFAGRSRRGTTDVLRLPGKPAPVSAHHQRYPADASLIAGLNIITADDKLSITVHDKIGIMAGKDQLSAALGFPKLLHNFGTDFAVNIVFRLVDKKRSAVLIQQHC